MKDLPAPKLPEGYYFCDQTQVAPIEIMEVRGKVKRPIENMDIWKRCIDKSLAIVGVRNNNKQLVGIGFLTGSIRHAILCDFTVDPTHQGKGIGTAILYKRLGIAHELGVRYIYTELDSANPLRPKYLKLGFEATGDGLFYDRTH